MPAQISPSAWHQQDQGRSCVSEIPRESTGGLSSVPGEQSMAGVDFEVLRREIALAQVLNLLQWEPNSRNETQQYGPCPLRDCKTGRDQRCFSVNLRLSRFYCHACRRHGNPLELWAEVRETSIYQAAIDLCKMLGRDVPWSNRG